MRLLWLSLLLFGPVIQAAVLAIDYGAEFTKLSLVKPGVPFDVILDRDSKRKISSVVGWKREDRVFGAEGKMSVSNLLYRDGADVSRQDSQKLISLMSSLYLVLNLYPLPSLRCTQIHLLSIVQKVPYTLPTLLHHHIYPQLLHHLNKHGHRLPS
jgi:hypothetical protein